MSSLDFSAGFASPPAGLTLNGSAHIKTPSLELTDGGGGEAGSAFSTTPISVAKFTTEFRFQLINPNADGFAFVIQGVGPNALGPSGGGLGYGPDHAGGSGGIANSVALKFDLYDNQGEGIDSTGLFTNGEAPTVDKSSGYNGPTGFVDLSKTAINLHSGDVFDVSMTYDGTTLSVTITAPKAKASTTQRYTVDIPSIVGGTTAYVGFSGGTGGQTATETVDSWVYQLPAPPPPPPTPLAIQVAPTPPPPIFVVVPASQSTVSYFVATPAGSVTPFSAVPIPSATQTSVPGGVLALSARVETGGGDAGNPNAADIGLALTKPSTYGPSINTLHLPLANLLTPAERRKATDDRVILGAGEDDEDTSERDALFATLIGGEVVREKDLFGQLFIEQADPDENGARLEAPPEEANTFNATVLWFVLTAVATEASLVFRSK